jgi:hypothetical protein
VRAAIALLGVMAVVASCGQDCPLSRCAALGDLEVTVVEPDGSSPKMLTGRVRQDAAPLAVSCPAPTGCTRTGLVLGPEGGMLKPIYVELQDGSGHSFTGTVAVELHPGTSDGCSTCAYRTATVSLE